MNEARRQQIRLALNKLGEATTILEVVKDEEEEARENLPESLQEGEQGEKMQENVDALTEALNDIESIESNLEDLCN